MGGKSPESLTQQRNYVPRFDPDLLNALLYMLEGNGKYALLSGIAAIPLVGYVANVVKHWKKLDRIWDFLKAANKRLGNRRSFSNELSKVRTKKVEPLKDAMGPHTTWKGNTETGKITRHET